MNIQRIKAIVTKEWKGIIRQPAILFLIILFPMVMTFTYGIAFGGMSTGTDDITYSIGVVSLNTTESIWTEHFIDNLTANEVFNIGFYDDNESAQEQLSQGALSAVIIIPKDFSDSIESLWNDIYADGEANDTASWTNVTLSIYLDEGS
ncbi:MAG: ABC transporter permease, partial [archaeon]|nr:ABC transporter permease [archaeon]